jgi:hypothetical protein
MKALEIGKQEVRLSLNRDELRLVKNALNEVCNGIHISEPEFKTRLGESRVDAQKLLTEVGDTYRALPDEHA